jgi:hypothetical protein
LCTNPNLRVRRDAASEARVRRGITLRAILCGPNKLVDEWNELVHEMIAEDARRLGEPPGHTYHSHNAPGTVGDDNGEHELAERAFADDARFLDRVDASVPRERIHLQVGDCVLLSKNMCSRSGLVKNALFTVAAMRASSLVLRDAKGRLHTVPRARFIFNVNKQGNIRLARKQVPVVHAWAFTVHKGQGQTCDRTLIDTTRPFWDHGQAYTALGRTMTSADTGAFVDENSCIAHERRGQPPVPIIASVCHPELLARQ